MRLLVTCLLAGLAGSAAAQLPSASATAFASGDAFIARARGFNSVAWNAAGLGMPDNPRFSATIASVQAVASLGPVGIGDFKEYEGDTVPFAVREQWLQDIEQAGGLSGGALAGLTELGASYGPFALQLATQAGVFANIGPGAAELIFFGNAGRTGEPRDISAAGSAAFATATTTLGASYGRALMKGPRTVAAGVTLKYTMGHMLAFAFDGGTNLTTTPLGGQVFFPMFQTKSSGGIMKNLNNGSGVGLDVGVMSSSNSPWRWGASIQNVVNTFQWDASKFLLRPNILQLVDSGARDFGVYELDQFPEIAEVIEDLAYKPVIGLGASYEASSWTGALDLRRRTDEDGLEGGPMTQVGAGVEWRRWPMVPLMFGTSWSSDAFTVSGGVALRFAGVSATLGGGLAKTENGSDPVLAFTLSTGTR